MKHAYILLIIDIIVSGVTAIFCTFQFEKSELFPIYLCLIFIALRVADK